MHHRPRPSYRCPSPCTRCQTSWQRGSIGPRSARGAPLKRRSWLPRRRLGLRDTIYPSSKNEMYSSSRSHEKISASSNRTKRSGRRVRPERQPLQKITNMVTSQPGSCFKIVGGSAACFGSEAMRVPCCVSCADRYLYTVSLRCGPGIIMSASLWLVRGCAGFPS